MGLEPTTTGITILPKKLVSMRVCGVFTGINSRFKTRMSIGLQREYYRVFWTAYPARSVNNSAKFSTADNSTFKPW